MLTIVYPFGREKKPASNTRVRQFDDERNRSRIKLGYPPKSLANSLGGVYDTFGFPL